MRKRDRKKSRCPQCDEQAKATKRYSNRRRVYQCTCGCQYICLGRHKPILSISMPVAAELLTEFAEARDRMIERCELDICQDDAGHLSGDGQFLVWYLWGENGVEMLRSPGMRDPVRWLIPPSLDWQCRSRIAAFETIAAWGPKLARDMIVSYMLTRRGYKMVGIPYE